MKQEFLTKEEIEQAVDNWKDGLSDEQWITLLKKHGHYYHDIGVNTEEVMQMWKDETGYNVDNGNSFKISSIINQTKTK